MEFTDLLHTVRTQDIHITVDSRTVQEHGIFVAITGVQADGTAYISAAVAAGAAFIVCDTQNTADTIRNTVLDAGAIIIHHPEPRKALWQLAAARYKTEELCQKHTIRIIGVTGTNGKTTSAYILEHLFNRLGHKVGVLGTVSYRWPGHEEPAPLTTPDSLTIHNMLKRMAEAGVSIVIMEVSSHALLQERVGGIPFAGALFSNLTQDHLDFHKDMEEYFVAKSLLFTDLPIKNKAIAINTDDTFGARLFELCATPSALAYGLNNSAHATNSYVQGHICSMSTKGIHMRMQWGAHTWELHSPLVGAFNAYNLLGVQSLALGLGVSIKDLAHLENFRGVCGRLERVDNTLHLHVFVDYAHTPDALKNVLQSLRDTGFHKIITVFGCGGNRDKSKRPLMGQAVAQWSDVAVVTSDNPRFEEPEAIIADIIPGIQDCPTAREGLEIIVEPDRRTATAKALQLLQKPAYAGAALLIAGKGHEDYQIIAGVKHDYSDQRIVQEIVACV